MCGIVGFIDPNPSTSPETVVESMSRRLRHRGPDDEGSWVDMDGGIGLGHCRLSILDLSQAGHQPMVSANERYVLTYNGELYNHVELRRELARLGAAPDWRGHSDTETLLAALSHWGMPEGLERVNGMFAFGLWDRAERVLHLARDRLGEKPLYYGSVGGVFMFASELGALTAHPRWHGQIDLTALSLLLKFGYVPAPLSIYEGISKLPPAHHLKIQRRGDETAGPVGYWNLESVAREGNTPPRTTPGETVDRLHELLTDSVRGRMQADVPVGCFLSGGIDSSAVTAVMQAQAPRPIKTFTIGFRERSFDEAAFARKVAEHLGTDHTELYVNAEDALRTVPQLPEIWDEPFADPSQIPTFLVSRLASSEVKVVLSGDGGDELFYGYPRYLRAQRLWSLLDPMSPGFQKGLKRALKVLPISQIDRLLLHLDERVRPRPVGPRINKLIDLINRQSRAGFYEEVVSHWSEPATATAHTPERVDLIQDLDLPWLVDLSELMMWVDTHLYLPDDILVKVDRATMAMSLEARVPLLDHRIVEFAWQIPRSQKRREGVSKWPLRQVLHRYVPKEMVERPKMGFGVPIESWLRGPLREWGEELLRAEVLRNQGFLRPEAIRGVWDAHQSGRGRYHFQLWNILMFQAWLDIH